MSSVLDQKWDLVIANPFLNEVGIILGNLKKGHSYKRFGTKTFFVG